MTRKNVCIFLALITFWIVGALIPLIFHPKSYVKCFQPLFPESEKYKFNKYLYSNEVYAYLEKLPSFYNSTTKLFSLEPNTFKGREIKVVELHFPDCSYGKEIKGTIVIVGGISAAAWDSVSACIDIIHKLCEDYRAPYLTNFQWFIIPILNPDGYDFSLTIRDSNISRAKSPKNRVYYNLSQNKDSCCGVNIDRNFGFHWGGSKPIDYSDFCWDEFAGLYPFSENESRAFQTFISNLQKSNQPVTMYLQLQSSNSIDLITYPWRFTQEETFNKPILDAMAETAAIKANTIKGAYFKSVQSSRNYLANGVICDWIMGVMNVLYSFSIEPTFIPANSTDTANQMIYIKKATVVVFSLTRYLLQLL